MVDFFKGRQDDSAPRVLRDVRRQELQYAAEITYMDHHVGRLLDYLHSRALLDDALVVATSDHGESLWEHNEVFNHGFKVYQSTMHSAFFIRLPDGRLGGEMTDRPTANIDVLPTVLAFLEMSVPAGVDGNALDLRKIGEVTSHRSRFGQASKPWDQVETDPRWANMAKPRCIRDGPFEFIHSPYESVEELYNVQRDPNEITNLLEDASPETAELADRLRRQLEAWAASGSELTNCRWGQTPFGGLTPSAICEL